MIKKYTLKALQVAINHALALDETMPEKMVPLHGKVVEIVISPLNVVFYIRFHYDQLQLLSQYEGSADVIIHSSPLGLIRLSVLPASKVRSLFNDSIRISGDVLLGQRVKTLFDSLDIDWEGHLAHFTGDVVAHQVGSLFRKGIAFKKQIRSSLKRNVTEFLQEERRLFPPREEVEDFFHDVDDVALQLERLIAHINHLMICYETD